MTDGSAAGLLEVQNLDVYYGLIPGVLGLSLRVPSGAIVALLGANGAGKTTTIRAVAGLVNPRMGQITLGGRSLTKLSAERRSSLGLATVSDDRLLFPSLSVVDNLRAGAYGRQRAEQRAEMKAVYCYFPDLKARTQVKAGSLSGGQAQMLAIGRALMSKPSVLLLDEPSQGLAPKIVEQIFDLLRRINAEEKVSILLVEQNARIALEIASYGYVLQNGRLALEGPTSSLRDNIYVQQLYLGG